MSSDWKEVTLEEITTLLGDGLHGTPNYDDSGDYYFINGRNLSEGKIILDEKTKRANEEEYLKHKKDLNDRTILVSINGTLGNIAFYNDENVFLGKSACYFNVNDEVEKEFIYYVLKNDVFQNHIDREATGTTIKNVSLKTMRGFSFKLPPLETQEKIVSILGSIDQKIHLNQHTNETLEAMAQAIFKSWFVDFDPVRAKIKAASAGSDPNRAAMAAIAGVSMDQDWDEIEAALDQKLNRMTDEQRQQLSRTAELFPDELVESEIGVVPIGWEYDQLGNFITVKRGGSPRPIKDYVVDEGFHWTKIADATSENSPFILKTKEFIKEEGLKKTVLLDSGSLILSNSATPGLPKFLNIDACIHDGWLYFPEKRHFSDLYLYHLFIEIRRALVAKGSGTVFTNLKTSILREYDVVVANESLVNEFTKLAQSMFSAIKLNRMETENLSNLRDTLLPKLISGELKLLKQ